MQYGNMELTHCALAAQSRGNFVVYNTNFNCLIVLKFRIGYGNITVVICANSKNERATEK